MVQSDPVSDLVCCGASQVEVLRGTSRKGRVEHDNTVVHGVTCVVCREGGITEKSLGITIIETDSVEVERFGISLSKSVLHDGLQVGIRRYIVEPGWVQRPHDILQLET